MAKLNEKTVKKIRQRFAMGTVSQSELAREHGVSPATIHGIVWRKKWKHV